MTCVLQDQGVSKPRLWGHVSLVSMPVASMPGTSMPVASMPVRNEDILRGSVSITTAILSMEIMNSNHLEFSQEFHIKESG